MSPSPHHPTSNFAIILKLNDVNVSYKKCATLPTDSTHVFLIYHTICSLTISMLKFNAEMNKTIFNIMKSF
jgi:hypothetical protein